MTSATPQLSWPTISPAFGPVVLREFQDADVPFAVELSHDPYVPLVGTLPAHATSSEAQSWIERQRGRLAEGAGFSFAIADAVTNHAVGSIGLWLKGYDQGRATAGYAVSPVARGRGFAAAALRSLTTFAWTLPTLHRVELYIEPSNGASIRTAESVLYQREGLLRSHQQIGDSRRDMLLYSRIRRDGP